MLSKGHDHIPFLILILLLFPLSSQADIFQYTDQNGTVVMVDDESSIPPKQRKKARTIKSDPGGASKSTAVRVVKNRVYVPVRLSYRNTIVDAWLLLDTGATSTMISTQLAARLGIKPASTQRSMAQVADGRVLETFWTRIDYMAVGPKPKYNAEVTILPSNGPAFEFDGLLGMNFLREFRYHLDVNNEMIEWLQ